MRIFVGAGFLIVDGRGMPERAFPYGSAAGCIVERRLWSAMNTNRTTGTTTTKADERKQLERSTRVTVAVTAAMARDLLLSLSQAR